MSTFRLKYTLNGSEKETRFDAINYVHALKITEAVMEGLGRDFGVVMMHAGGEQVQFKAEFMSLARVAS